MSETQGQRPSLWTLFTSTFLISACTFGGGFVIAGLMKKRFVDALKWIDDDTMMDYIVIAQSCPGPIAVNTAILAGLHVRGLAGMLTAVLGTILPPMIILAIVEMAYAAFASSRLVALLLKGMQAGVSALLLDVVVSLGKRVTDGRDAVDIIVMAAAFIAVAFLKVKVLPVILTALALGILRALLSARKEQA